MPMQTAALDSSLPPSAVYGSFRRLPYPVLLESTLKHPDLGRYSFVAADPFLVFEVKNGSCAVNGTAHHEDPLVLLRRLLGQYRLPAQTGLPPFIGGAIGFFSYDFGWELENLPRRTEDDLKIPDCLLCFYDTVVAFDHKSNSALLYATGFPLREEKDRRARAWTRLQFFQNLLSKSDPEEFSFPASSGKLTCHFNRATYREALKKVINYILAGDIYQVNLSQRFSAPFSGSPFDLYRQLSWINPAPFAALFEWRDFAVVSASPERYLRLKDSLVETRPIKGTRPRGKNPAEDIRLRDELWNSAKDRAELTMIVDLARNDLGRVCVPGSVKVAELFRLEQYATVWHLVSTVQGRMPPGKDILDVLRSSFPGGSISGAPKIRAMEIIEELEPVKRSIYTGSIGYLGFNGACDLNIVIRTFMIKDGMAHIQVGGGITADSNPDDEYRETLDKAKALFKSLGRSGGQDHASLD